MTDVWPSSEAIPYLVAVDDPYDTASPYHRWGPLVFTAKGARAKLKVPGPLRDLRTVLTPSGRVGTLAAVGPKGETQVTSGDVRRLLGLRSTWFRVGVLTLAQPAATRRSRRPDHAHRHRAWPDRDLARAEGSWSGLGAAGQGEARGRRRIRDRGEAHGDDALPPRVRDDRALDADSRFGLRPAGPGHDGKRVKRLLLTCLVLALAAPGSASAARFAVGLEPGASKAAVARDLRAATGGAVTPLAPFGLVLQAPSARGTAAIPGIRYVERLKADRRISFVPTDPLAARQWYLPQIHAFDAWPVSPVFSPASASR